MKEVYCLVSLYVNLELQPYLTELSYYKQHKVQVVIFDADCKIVGFSAYLEQLLESRYSFIGKSFNDFNTEEIALLTRENNPEYLRIIRQNYRKLHKLLQITFIEKTCISYLDLIPYNTNRESYLTMLIPLCNSEGIMIGVRMISSNIGLYGINDYFASHIESTDRVDKIEAIDNTPNPFYLTPRQQEIVYLLANGLSQVAIASKLGLARGSVANTISEQICPKFGIAGSSTKLLFIKARELELHRYMPLSLYKPRIIVLDAELIEKYFTDDIS